MPRFRLKEVKEHPERVLSYARERNVTPSDCVTVGTLRWLIRDRTRMEIRLADALDALEEYYLEVDINRRERLYCKLLRLLGGRR